MATTTNYGWVTPDDTALVKDGAAAIRTLGSSADTTTKNLNPETTLGDLSFRSSTSNVNTRIPIGSSGQHLTVVAGVPAWSTASDQTPLTTKGDLFSFSTVDARLGVGANGTTLVADSSEATGLKWQAPAGSSLTLIIPTSTANSGGTVTTSANGAVTFTGCTSVSLNGVFSSTYTNYLILTDNISANTQTDVKFRLRASGTNATTNYNQLLMTQAFATNVGTVTSLGNTAMGTTDFYIGDGNATDRFYHAVTISNPEAATKTCITAFFIDDATYSTMGGYQTDATQFDGFSLFTATNNISGVTRVYGYSK